MNPEIMVMKSDSTSLIVLQVEHHYWIQFRVIFGIARKKDNACMFKKKTETKYIKNTE